jgi:hypothetical protein
MLYLGIDNGVSGTVGIIGETRRESKSDVYFKMPIKKVLDYCYCFIKCVYDSPSTDYFHRIQFLFSYIHIE